MSIDRRFLVGLTGGIGSGKSTVADLFAKLGICIVDSDELAHRLTASGGVAIPLVREAFGDEYVTSAGAMDRPRMRALVFQSDADRRKLESILHPLIRAATDQEVAAASSDYVIAVVPLLFESGHWRDRFTRTLAVDCPEEIQIARVVTRSGLSRAEIAAIMSRQVSRAKRLELADDVIENSGDSRALLEGVEALHQRYLKLAQMQARL